MPPRSSTTSTRKAATMPGTTSGMRYSVPNSRRLEVLACISAASGRLTRKLRTVGATPSQSENHNPSR